MVTKVELVSKLELMNSSELVSCWNWNWKTMTVVGQFFDHESFRIVPICTGRYRQSDTWLLDYCSSDWDFESDDELDAEDIKKEGMIGYFYISFTAIFMTFLIVAYLQSTYIPLCIWKGFKTVQSFSIKDLLFGANILLLVGLLIPQ